MYAHRTSILALIAAAAVGIAVNSTAASAKDGHTPLHNGSSFSHNTSGPKQSGGSSHMTTANRDHDHDHDHDHYRDHDHSWQDKWCWEHHDSDRCHEHHYRYVPTEPVRPYVVRPVIVEHSPPNCLTKEYLGPDTVLFKDICTKQWAKNSTNNSTRVANADAKCLTKENLQGGAVLFKDLCTSEWAMTPADQALPSR